MYKYEVRKFYTNDKRGIMFLPDVNDEDFRAALSAVFEPLGFFCDYQENYLYTKPGPTVPPAWDISVANDEWFVWFEAHSYGHTALNHTSIAFVDDLLQQSGVFRKVADANEAEADESRGDENT